MGALVFDKDVSGMPWGLRLAVAAGALGLLGVGTLLTAPAAWAGAVESPPTLRQVAGGRPQGAPLQGTPPGGPLAPGQPPAPAAPASPGAPPAAASAPAFNARPPGPPAAPSPPPVANAEPSVRVVLAPDARGPLPPAVTMAASQIPANAMTPAGTPGTQTPASSTAGASPNGMSAGTFSLASVSAPGTGSGPTRVDAAPSAALRLTSIVQSQLGARYTWGGTTPTGGFDCSGFVYWAYSQIGHPLPRVMTDQYAAGRRVRVEELLPGDVLFYQNTYTAGLSHNGIYVGDGKFIHAADESTGVVTTPVHTAYWEQHFAGAIRVLD